MSPRVGTLILEANRMNKMGRYEECMPKYLEALELEMDNRSRFVILVNLGNVYLTLAMHDELVRKQRRSEARHVWLEALGFEEGGSDRAKVALDAGDLCLEDGMYARAARLYRKCIEHDDPATGLSKLAHEKLGSTSRLVGSEQNTARSSQGSSSPASRTSLSAAAASTCGGAVSSTPVRAAG